MHTASGAERRFSESARTENNVKIIDHRLVEDLHSIIDVVVVGGTIIGLPRDMTRLRTTRHGYISSKTANDRTSTTVNNTSQ